MRFGYSVAIILVSFSILVAPTFAHDNDRRDDRGNDRQQDQHQDNWQNDNHGQGSSGWNVQLLPEFRPIGGGGNNLKHPNFDPTPGMPMLAIVAPQFKPGAGDQPLDGPSPRTISNVIGGGQGANGENADTEDPVASAWLYVFGQFLDHDIDLEETPQNGTPLTLTVPAGDPSFPKGAQIPLTRATRNPVTRTTINTTAGYLDLSQLYGSNQPMADYLRNADGTLKSTGNGEYLYTTNTGYIVGDPRVTENPELTAITTLFMREHNRLAGLLHQTHPKWNGDQLYNMARSINIAEYQNIIYTEYLPVLLGQRAIHPYSGYNPHVVAQVTQEFAVAVFRVGHSQVSDTQEGIDNNGNVVFSQPLAEAFLNTPEKDEANGVNPMLRGISADASQATDPYLVATLRNLLFAPLPGGDIDLIDLMAIDIERERDVGLGSLNQTRRALGLNPYHSFAELTSDPVLQANMKSVYGNIGNVDLFVGGLAEKHVMGGAEGQTFETVITQQFEALRDGDRFWWENEGFDPQTKQMIAHTGLGDLILANTDTTHQQANVFLAPLPQTHNKSHARSHQLVDQLHNR